MNMKQIICVAKMFVITARTCVVCPLRSVLHDNSKPNMAAIVNKVYSDKAPWSQHLFSISHAFFIKACGGRLDGKLLCSGKQKIINI